jgi:hypothetical protein
MVDNGQGLQTSYYAVSSQPKAYGQAHQCYLSVIAEPEENRNSLREGFNELVEEGLTLIK